MFGLDLRKHTGVENVGGEDRGRCFSTEDAAWIAAAQSRGRERSGDGVGMAAATRRTGGSEAALAGVDPRRSGGTPSM